MEEEREGKLPFKGPTVTFFKVKHPAYVDRQAVEVRVKGYRFFIEAGSLKTLLGMLEGEVWPHLPWNTRSWEFEWDVEKVKS